MGLGLRRRLETASGASPALRRLLTLAHFLRTDVLSRGLRHPLDRRYGVRTQAPLPLHLSQTGSSADAHMIPYAGCVPSVLRRALEALAPDFAAAGFIDLGCGKGRALVVASEYPFHGVLGVELNPDLVRAARANARRIARRHPARTPIDVREGDASRPALPDGDAVVFLYHPFGAPLVRRLCDHLAEHRSGRLLVVYENPVHGAAFDAHPGFARAYAAMLELEPDEAGFGFDDTESVVAWRLSRPGDPAPVAGAEAQIVTIKPEYRVVVR